MLEARPSRTAYRVALRRAAHQLADRPPVFEDPLAIKILGPDGGERLRAEPSLLSSTSRPFRAFFAVRSRFAEDALAAAVARGATQYVVLGAGLDTFAYRNPYPTADLRVFEVDHPATQEWKRQLLVHAGIAIPDSMRFVPVDFERQQLSTALEQAAFSSRQVTFFSWLGVVPYLSAGSFQQTIAMIATMPTGSEVAFDYAVPRGSLNFIERLAFDRLAARVKAAGEPFQLFFEPQALIAQMRQAGFTEVEDAGAPELNPRYFQQRSDGLNIRGGLGRLLRAQV